MSNYEWLDNLLLSLHYMNYWVYFKGILIDVFFLFFFFGFVFVKVPDLLTPNDEWFIVYNYDVTPCHNCLYSAPYYRLKWLWTCSLDYEDWSILHICITVHSTILFQFNTQFIIRELIRQKIKQFQIKIPRDIIKWKK